jgi:hypothetical protein
LELEPRSVVGVATGEDVTDEEFLDEVGRLFEEFETLTKQSRNLEASIVKNVSAILAGVETERV